MRRFNRFRGLFRRRYGVSGQASPVAPAPTTPTYTVGALALALSAAGLGITGVSYVPAGTYNVSSVALALGSPGLAISGIAFVPAATYTVSSVNITAGAMGLSINGIVRSVPGVGIYFSASASDGVGDGTYGNPYSVNEMKANAAAGETWIGLAETYAFTVNTAVGNDKWKSPMMPDNSGTSGSPIIIMAEYAACNLSDVDANRSVITTSGTVATGKLATMGRSYITFDGWFCDENDCSTPQVSDGLVAGFHSGTGCIMQNCRIIAKAALGDGTNHAAMRIEVTTGCKLLNNKVTSAGTYSEENGVLVYSSNTYYINNNEVIGGRSGIRLKGEHRPDTLDNPAWVQNNKVYGFSEYGINIQGPKPSGSSDSTGWPGAIPDEFLTVTQNLVIAAGSAYALAFRQYDIISPSYVLVSFNTFVSSAGMINIIGQDTTSGNILLQSSDWIGNIFYSTGTTKLVETDTGLAVDATMYDRISANDNCFYGLDVSGGVFVQRTSSGTYTFAEWQAAGRDVDSLTADPLFVGGGDYHLQSSSPCLPANGGPATDYLSLVGGGAVACGCYMTGSDAIGVQAA